VVVVGIQRPDGTMQFNPAPETAMEVGDFLVVLGQTKNLRDLEAAAGQPVISR
jgi:K+/H+ antiporter YhaU regulatory subunit KhtT